MQVFEGVSWCTCTLCLIIICDIFQKGSIYSPDNEGANDLVHVDDDGPTLSPISIAHPNDNTPVEDVAVEVEADGGGPEAVVYQCNICDLSIF